MTRDQDGTVTLVLLFWVDEALHLSAQLPARPLIELVNDRVLRGGGNRITA
jgi:hypothetical protein